MPPSFYWGNNDMPAFFAGWVSQLTKVLRSVPNVPSVSARTRGSSMGYYTSLAFHSLNIAENWLLSTGRSLVEITVLGLVFTGIEIKITSASFDGVVQIPGIQRPWFKQNLLYRH